MTLSNYMSKVRQLRHNVIHLFIHSCQLVPFPTWVNITSEPVSPIQPNRSQVILICTVELNPAVDVPVIVYVWLTDPAGNLLTITTTSVSGSTYTTTATIRSFGREQSGVYSCAATVNSSSPYLTNSSLKSGMAYVTVGNSNTCF